MRTEYVVKKCEQAGLRVLDFTPWTECEDGLVQLEGDIHISVGDDYATVSSFVDSHLTIFGIHESGRDAVEQAIRLVKEFA